MYDHKNQNILNFTMIQWLFQSKKPTSNEDSSSLSIIKHRTDKLIQDHVLESNSYEHPIIQPTRKLSDSQQEDSGHFH